MPVEQAPVEVKPNGHPPAIDPTKYGGVVKPRGQTQLAQEYIIPGKNFEEALARTTIRDPNFLNNIVQLKAQMDMFNKEGLFNDRIKALVNLLNGQNALNGINRSLSAMVGTGIYFAEGAGIKMSKEDKERLQETQRIKYGAKRDDKEGE
jgi:hypothetical protein